MSSKNVEKTYCVKTERSRRRGKGGLAWVMFMEKERNKENVQMCVVGVVHGDSCCVWMQHYFKNFNLKLLYSVINNIFTSMKLNSGVY